MEAAWSITVRCHEPEANDLSQWNLFRPLKMFIKQFCVSLCTCICIFKTSSVFFTENQSCHLTMSISLYVCPVLIVFNKLTFFLEIRCDHRAIGGHPTTTVFKFHNTNSTFLSALLISEVSETRYFMYHIKIL